MLRIFPGLNTSTVCTCAVWRKCAALPHVCIEEILRKVLKNLLEINFCTTKKAKKVETERKIQSSGGGKVFFFICYCPKIGQSQKCIQPTKRKTMQSFRNLVFFTLLTLQGALPWTIDLPEVRQYYFTKNGEVPPKTEASKTFAEGEALYDNFYSNSPHHNGNPGYVGPVDHRGDDDDDEAVKGGQYAEDFEYQSYMEKKVINYLVGR